MTAWNGTLPQPLAGAEITATDVDTLRDAIGGVVDTWTSYTPTWSSSGTQPVLNNGTITGKYIRSGKFVTANVNLTMGGTTTFGTGTYFLSLPITAASTADVGAALIYDSSVDTNRRAGAAVLSTTSLVAFYADGTVAATVPFTWASSDVLRFTITYEAA